MIDSLLVLIVGQLFTAAAIWGGIRADLRALHARMDRAERRIDSFIERRSHAR